MPFGLKNAGATYQWFVNKVFMTLIGKAMEVYVDDMITRTIKEVNHVPDMAEIFKIVKTYTMKLNPKKCIFEVRSGKFLRP